MKKSLILAIAALSFFLASCKGMQKNTLLDQIKAKGEMNIAIEGVWAPWSFHNDKGELIGFDVEVAEAVCERIGVRPRFVEVVWERILPGVESGIYDVAFNGVAITAEREGNFYFSNPYCSECTVLIVHKDNDTIKSFADLKGRSCANALESNYCKIGEDHGAFTIAIDSLEEEMKLVAEGRAESTINADASFFDYLNSNPSAPLKIVDKISAPIPIGVPTKKTFKNYSLIQEINGIFKELKADGTLTAISLKYFGRDITK